ncbi:serine-rich adhesin for platelets-like [Littorina saxatilis]|uniref:serine-rich adhesin for platelets-like n=1 Tax=Littorina saxatilis TaxID=31220 RepID=UPI0038B5A361
MDSHWIDADVAQTTVRLYSGGHKLLVMHIYATNTILVQGKQCIAWVKDEFQRLQAVVHIMAELSSVTTEAVTTAVKDVTLVPPPLTAGDSGTNTENCNAKTDTSAFSTAPTVSSEDGTSTTRVSGVGAAAITNGSADPGVSNADSAAIDDEVPTGTTDSTNTLVPPPLTAGDSGTNTDNCNAKTDTSAFSTAPTVSSEDGTSTTSVSGVGAAAITNGSADPGVSSADSAAIDDEASTGTTDSTNTLVPPPLTAGDSGTNTDNCNAKTDTSAFSTAPTVSSEDGTSTTSVSGVGAAAITNGSADPGVSSADSAAIDYEASTGTTDSTNTNLSNNETDTASLLHLRDTLDALVTEFRDYKVQVSREFRVIEQQHERKLLDLQERQEASDKETDSLRKRCQSLEDKIKELKRLDKKSIRNETSPNHPQADDRDVSGQSDAKPIQTLINNGRYAQPSGRSTVPTEYKKLLEAIVTHFPTATTFVAAIPPQSHHKRNEKISKINSELANICGENVSFLSLKSVWKRDQQGKINPGLLADKVHYSARGLSLLLREAKAVLYEASTDTKKEHASYASVTKQNTRTSPSEQGLQRPSQVAPSNKADERQYSDQDQRNQKPAARPAPWQTLHTQERMQQAPQRHPSTGKPPLPMWLQHQAMSDEPTIWSALGHPIVTLHRSLGK